MQFQGNEFELFAFYEELTESQKDEVERMLRDIIPELRRVGVDEGDLYQLRCSVAKDKFGQRLILG